MGQLVQFLLGRAVDVFLEDGIRFEGLELGLEVVEGMSMVAAIGAATSVGEFVPVILGFVTGVAPGW